MHVNGHRFLSSANRRARRARRTTGRILVSALGFGVAYYLDTENGEVRRQRLFRSLRRSAHRLDSALTSGAEDPPPALSAAR